MLFFGRPVTHKRISFEIFIPNSFSLPLTFHTQSLTQMKQSNASLDAPFLMAGIAAVAAGVLFSPLVLTLSPVALLVAPVNLLFWKFYSAKLHHFLPIFRLGQLYLIATYACTLSSSASLPVRSPSSVFFISLAGLLLLCRPFFWWCLFP